MTSLGNPSLSRRRWLGWAAAAALPATAQTPAADEDSVATPSASEQRLQQLMQVRRGQMSPEATRERLGLLARGQALMAAGELDAAQADFDAAALMLHAADTEIALVRCYMQRGEYQRAISFGAHAAGAHREVSAGAVLYAWLLRLGGQGVFAARLLDEAVQLRPADALLEQARAALRQRPLQASVMSGMPFALGPLPLGSTTFVQGDLRVVATATRVGVDGLALAPLSALNGRSALCLRDGLGRTVAGTPRQVWPDLGLALLEAPGLPNGAAPVWAARDAFPGSPACAVEHVAAGQAPAWPQLQLGFLGALRPDGSRALGLDMPRGPRGGPVLDLQGRMVGLAMAHEDGVDRLLPASLLRQRLDLPGPALEPSSGTSTPQRLSMAAVYELALPQTLQVITA